MSIGTALVKGYNKGLAVARKPRKPLRRRRSQGFSREETFELRRMRGEF